ncbi:MAG TPA: hypothetical protein VFV19_02960 [Candidatus Polarisedimenticolaceae bacterium]|nr:hypothetical protein [Candidatus Polarisedimenticolaceae bacterium]
MPKTIESKASAHVTPAARVAAAIEPPPGFMEAAPGYFLTAVADELYKRAGKGDPRMELRDLAIVAARTAPALLSIASSLEADADAMGGRDDGPMSDGMRRAIRNTTYGSVHTLEALASELKRAARDEEEA